mgnify:CR=1 FL=1
MGEGRNSDMAGSGGFNRRRFISSPFVIRQSMKMKHCTKALLLFIVEQ